MERSTFVGRDRECERLLAMVPAVPLVTVTGTAGIGKSRLVGEVAHRLPGEVLRRDLDPLPAGSPLEGVVAQVGNDPQALALTLARSSQVLVLDNCEHVVDGVALFVDRLLAVEDRPPVIVTSREPLGLDGEHLLVLDPLAVPGGGVDPESSPAVRLFLDRAMAAGAAWDRTPATLATVAALCRHLDGLPLAIELAAARARVLSPAELLELTARRLDLLREPARSRPGRGPRHHSLRAALDISVELLTTEERGFLQHLGVFGGAFDVGLAHDVAAPEADRLHTIDLLARLVDRSLVAVEHDRTGTRYHLLGVMRQHATEGLIRSGQGRAALERFVDAMVAEAEDIVVRGLNQWSGELLSRIMARFHDVVTAIDWCVDHDDDPTRSYRLILPLFATVHEGHAADVLAVGRRVIAQWPDRSALGRSEALAVVATAAAMAGDPATARTLGGAALADPGASDVGAMVAHRALGLVAKLEGDHPRARHHFRAGKEAAARLGAASFERELAGFEATMVEATGERTAAITLIGQVIGSATAAGDHLTEAWARLVLATLSLHGEDWDTAQVESRRATATIAALPYQWWAGAALRIEATIAALRPSDPSDPSSAGGWSAAAPIWQRAVDEAAKGSLGEVGLTVRAAAAVAARAGHETAAIALVHAAPLAADVSVLPEVFPDELRRIETLAADRVPPADLVTAVRRARAALEGRPEQGTAPLPVRPPRVEPRAEASLGRNGDSWAVVFGGRRVLVNHLKGVADLATLLAQPGREVHCLQLMGGADVDTSLGPVLDAQARRSYQQRISQLHDEIDHARNAGHGRAAERAEAELDALVEQLSQALGLGGRARTSGSSAERARAAVTYRIRSAIRRIDTLHPDLGRHLRNSIRTGTWCSYRPETDVAWTVVDQATPAAPTAQSANR